MPDLGLLEFLHGRTGPVTDLRDQSRLPQDPVVGECRGVVRDLQRRREQEPLPDGEVRGVTWIPDLVRRAGEGRLLPGGARHDARRLEDVVDVRGSAETEALRLVWEDVGIAVVQAFPELIEEGVARPRDRGAHIDGAEVARLVVQLDPLRPVAGPT